MPRKHRRLIWKNQQAILNRPQNFIHRTTPQVGTSYTSLKERIAAHINVQLLPGRLRSAVEEHPTETGTRLVREAGDETVTVAPIS